MDYNEENPYPVASLAGAVRMNSVAALNELIKKKRNVNFRDISGWTPLHNASINSKHKDCLLVLIKAGANVNAQTHEGETSLYFACRNNCIEIASILLDSGASVNLPNNEDITPLHIASARGYDKMVQLLIERSVHINVRDYNLYSPLHEAIEHNQSKVCEVLLRYGADLNLQNKDGNLPIHFACMYSNIEMLKIILNNYGDEDAVKAAVNSLNVDRYTPLMLAVQSKQMKMIGELLKRGADANLVGTDGDKNTEVIALHLAAHSGQLPVLKMIYEATSKDVIEKYCSVKDLNDTVECRKCTNKSLVCLAMDVESFECLEYLLGCGLSSDVLNCPIVEKKVNNSLNLLIFDYQLQHTACGTCGNSGDEVVLINPISFLLKYKIVDLQDQTIDYLKLLLQNGLSIDYVDCKSTMWHPFYSLAGNLILSPGQECAETVVDTVRLLIEHGGDPDLRIPGIQGRFYRFPILFLFACKTSIVSLLPCLFQNSNVIEPDDVYEWTLSQMFITHTFNNDVNTDFLFVFLLQIITKTEMPAGVNCSNIQAKYMDRFCHVKHIIDTGQSVQSLKELARAAVRKYIRNSCSFPYQFRIRLNSLPIPQCLIAFLSYEELEATYKSAYNIYLEKYFHSDFELYSSKSEEL